MESIQDMKAAVRVQVKVVIKRSRTISEDGTNSGISVFEVRDVRGNVLLLQ